MVTGQARIGPWGYRVFPRTLVGGPSLAVVPHRILPAPPRPIGEGRRDFGSEVSTAFKWAGNAVDVLRTELIRCLRPEL